MASERTVQFYTDVSGFKVKFRQRIDRSSPGVPIDLIYLDLGGLNRRHAPRRNAEVHESAQNPRPLSARIYEVSGNIGNMNEISPLLLQLLEWISDRPRSYAETMDVWRSSCPRLTIWEDALIYGLVQVEADGDGAHGLMVSLTALGRSALDTASCDRGKPARRQSVSDH